MVSLSENQKDEGRAERVVTVEKKVQVNFLVVPASPRTDSQTKERKREIKKGEGASALTQ